MEQTIFVTAPFPAQLEYRARMEAARQRISRSELVRRAVIDYLEQFANSKPSQDSDLNYGGRSQ